MSERPSWDPVRGRLRLSARQLGVLAAQVHAAKADTHEHDVQELVKAGLLKVDGAVPINLRAVATAAAGVRAQVAVTRRARRGDVRVGITWGEAGVIVMRAAGADRVTDIAVQPPTRLARTVWRVLQLGPRPDPSGRAAVEVDTDALLAPFSDREAAWTGWLGIDPATLVLDRLDVKADPRRPPASWALLDGGAHGLWDVTSAEAGGRLTLTPTSASAAYAAIAALQPVAEHS